MLLYEYILYVKFVRVPVPMLCSRAAGATIEDIATQNGFQIVEDFVGHGMSMCMCTFAFMYGYVLVYICMCMSDYMQYNKLPS